MKRIIITLLALVTLGGVASADRGHRGPVVRDHRTWSAPSHTYVRPSYTRPSYTYSRPSYTYSRPNVTVYSRPSYTYGRRHAIYVRRPAITYRYYNYYQRPAVIAENYPSMPGYIWVAGQWQWNGAEWIWQAGHYEPDANYQGDYYYDGTYDNGSYYYDQSTYTQPTIQGGIYFNSGY